MASIEKDIADALVTGLNAASFSQAITARSFFDEIGAAETISGIEVVCIPLARRTSVEARGLRQVRITAAVSVRKKLGTTGRDAEIDGLLVLADEIEAWLDDQEPDGAGFTEFDDGDLGREPASIDQLQSENVFSATMLPVFAKVKDLMAGFVTVKFDQFFDRQKVLERMERKESRVLSRTGAYARRVIRNSIRRSKKSAQQGRPPRAHASDSPNFKTILFGRGSDGDVLVGPIKFNRTAQFSRRRQLTERLKGVKSVPELHEKGGTRIALNKLTNQRTVQKYPRRPFIEPKIPVAAQKLAELMEKYNL